MYRNARKRVGLSIEEAAMQIHISSRSLNNYEQQSTIPPPDVVIQMDRVYQEPKLSAWYCSQVCDIGKKYCYELLNNVDLSPMGILAKYRQEEVEAHEAMENIMVLLLNKRGREDCSDQELIELRRWALEMLDLEHVIETMKIRLWDYVDVSELVDEHNRKCRNKKYVVEEAVV